jgi:hypothetical protein
MLGFVWVMRGERLRKIRPRLLQGRQAIIANRLTQNVSAQFHRQDQPAISGQIRKTRRV